MLECWRLCLLINFITYTSLSLNKSPKRKHIIFKYYLERSPKKWKWKGLTQMKYQKDEKGLEFRAGAVIKSRLKGPKKIPRGVFQGRRTLGGGAACIPHWEIDKWTRRQKSWIPTPVPLPSPIYPASRHVFVDLPISRSNYLKQHTHTFIFHRRAF